MVMVPGLLWSGSARRKTVKLFRQRLSLDGRCWRRFPPYNSKSGPYCADATFLNLTIRLHTPFTMCREAAGLPVGWDSKLKSI